MPFREAVVQPFLCSVSRAGVANSPCERAICVAPSTAGRESLTTVSRSAGSGSAHGGCAARGLGPPARDLGGFGRGGVWPVVDSWLLRSGAEGKHGQATGCVPLGRPLELSGVLAV